MIKENATAEETAEKLNHNICCHQHDHEDRVVIPILMTGFHNNKNGNKIETQKVVIPILMTGFHNMQNGPEIRKRNELSYLS